MSVHKPGNQEADGRNGTAEPAEAKRRDASQAGSLLKSPAALVLTAVLLVQVAAVHGISRVENPPVVPPLAEFPAEFQGWQLVEEGVVEKEIQDVLRADDTLNRVYRAAAAEVPVGLFIAYFRSQRTGVAPHSPKNCLPGSGWTASTSETHHLTVDGFDRPVPVNLYLVSKGDSRSVVLYWYQSYGKVIASEFAAKYHLVKDAIQYNRTDTALVRLVAPATGEDDKEARALVERFARDCLPVIRARLAF